jgi:hypothetical protein
MICQRHLLLDWQLSFALHLPSVLLIFQLPQHTDLMMEHRDRITWIGQKKPLPSMSKKLCKNYTYCGDNVYAIVSSGIFQDLNAFRYRRAMDPDSGQN